MSVRAAMLAAGVPASIAANEAPLAERAMREGQIDTANRSRMFLAQVFHESVGLRYFEEIASGAAYDITVDRRLALELGNTQPGDGRRFKGRGPIQLTGRANYRWAGGRLGLPLEQRPELAAHHDVGWRIAVLYWTSHGLNELADHGDFLAITRRINGGTNGLASRQEYLRRLARVDCRPAEDKLSFLTPTEHRWCKEYDHLAGKKDARSVRRRAALRRAMVGQRGRIRQAATGPGGWTAHQRARRYRSLLARTS